jgi:3-oxoacyl-[acyl-carrier protein] reductase
MENRFDGKVVAITGAGGGLGGKFVEEFCALGARVFGCDVRADTLERVRQPGAVAAVVDLRNPGEVAEWIASIEKAAGGAIDVLINCAGGTTAAPARSIEDVPDSEWDGIFDANIRATFYVCRAAVPAMKRARKGRIINISSGAGIAASRTKVHPYTAAKHAIVGLTRQMAAELGEFGITVNSVAPGFVISTPRTQKHWDVIPPEGQRAHLQKTFMRRLGKPDDVSNAVLFLASERSSWISGQILSVDGGLG